MAAESIPLFVDASAFVARFDERAPDHDRVSAVFEDIRERRRPYTPLFTSRYALSELATELGRRAGNEAAVTAVRAVREADSFNVLTVDGDCFDDAVARFGERAGLSASFADQLNAALAERNGVEHVFAAEGDPFRAMGFTVVPADTAEP